MINRNSSLTNRYLISLLLITLLAGLSYWISTLLIDSRKLNSDLINISGRQTVLVQKIGLVAHDYVASETTFERQIAREELEELVEVFESSHRSLVQGGRALGYQGSEDIVLQPSQSEALNRIYFGEDNLDEEVEWFVGFANDLLALPSESLTLDHAFLNYLEVESSQSLPTLLNKASQQYQLEGDRLINRLRLFESILLIGIFGVLIFEGVYIFLPLTRLFNKQSQMLKDMELTISEQAEREAIKTKDLALATNIGRRIVQISDLDELLIEAVNLVQSRFDLYYAQIYLLNQQNYELELRAGTGDVGQELLRKNFNLSIGLNSINGQAVIEKQPIIVSDTQKSLIFRQNKLLPETRSEVAIPLVHNHEVIGVLDLQANEVNAFTEENLDIFQTISAQLATSIQNSRLIEVLRQSEMKRFEAIREETRLGWDAFMDGVHEPRSFSYRQKGAGRLVHDGQSGVVVEMPIEVVGEQIGQVEVLLENGRLLTTEEKELMMQVSELASQRLESLRLLSMNERYRAETEEAIRRVTREAWQTVDEESSEAGFAFDLNKVSPLNGATGRLSTAVSKPIAVRGEPIGQIEVLDKLELTEAENELITAVSEQFSNHIESLRLTDQIEKALKNTETLYNIVSRLNEATSLQEILDAVVTSSIAQGYSGASYNKIESDQDGRPKWLIVTDMRSSEPVSEEKQPFPIGTRFDINKVPMTHLWLNRPNEVVVIEDVLKEESIPPQYRQIIEKIGERTIIFLPLNVRGRWLGVIRLAWKTVETFTESDLRLFKTISEQGAIVTNQLTLFDDATERANALAELSQIEIQISQAITQNDLLECVRLACESPDSMSLYHFENNEQGEPDSLYQAARWHGNEFHQPYPDIIPVTESHPIFNQWQTNPNQIIWIEDLDTFEEIDSLARQAYERIGIKSFMLMPLISFGRWQGALEVHWTEKHEFTESERFLLSQIMEAIAANVASKRSVAETEMLYQVSEKLNQAEDYKDILSIYKAFSPLASKADAVDIHYFNTPWTIHETPQYIEKVERINNEALNDMALPPKVHLKSAPYFNSLSREQATIIEDVTNNETFPDETGMRIYELTKAKSLLIFPLVVSQGWFGFVTFYYQAPTKFAWRDVQRLYSLTEQSAIAMQGIRLLRYAEAKALREQQIREITTKVRNSTNVETILRTAAQEMGKALGRHSVVYLEPNETEKNGQQ